jgi:glycerol-3-phosphate O-acyltransferase
MRFHSPWSLRTFINEQKTRYASTSPASSSEDQKIRLLRTLGYKVLMDINDVSVIMPTALIGTVLLTLRGRGVGHNELIRRVDWLADRVRAAGGRCAHFGSNPTSVVVERGLDVLGPQLVGVIPNLPEKTYYAVDRFQLSFYRNMTIHLFILQALVSAGMYTRVKQGGGPENQTIPYATLRREVEFLSQLFRGEFIFPTEGLDTNLANTIKGLERDEIISLQRNSSGEVIQVGLSDTERESGRENFDFYCFLIWPTIESFWLSAVSLLILVPPVTDDPAMPTSLDTKMVINAAQLLGKTLYHQGDLSNFEAVNKQTLQNAYARFEEEGIIQRVRKGGEKAVTTYRLAPSWMPTRHANGGIEAQGRLWEFAESISESRREGKNRRDGATVKTRVIGLVEKVGNALWTDAAEVAKTSGEKEQTEVTDDTVDSGKAEKSKAKRKRRDIRPVARL